MHKIVKPRLTSYEIVCATARTAPIREYFELEAQPEPRIVYTAKLDKVKIKIKDRFIEENWWGKVIGIQIVKAIERANIGDKKKMIEEAEKGFDGSFIKSFTPSAIGWSKP